MLQLRSGDSKTRVVIREIESKILKELYNIIILNESKENKYFFSLGTSE